MNTPITDRLQLKLGGSRVVRLEDARRLETDRAALMEALDKIASRHVIAGSAGDFRQGQLDALAACRDVSMTALSAARENFPS